MTVLFISLKDYIFDPEKKVDLASLTDEEAIDLIKKSYGFLASTIDISINNGIAIINLKEPSPQETQETEKIYNRGLQAAEQGDYACLNCQIMTVGL